ncbi:tripartite tricarboxylate transporter TctB family protein [Methylopila sp. M107]|uniref:tripartite tricarboxylate transporter TctB family protein n=1 Tax=Methylopila sp. M107 TaxID=1101190 RepID=UPI000370263C|nr:tripartite tricarboxylate transporter TctB family protein [Methylopila sp. M107]
MTGEASAGRRFGPIAMAVGMLAIAAVVAVEAKRLSAVTLYGGDIGPAVFPWIIAAGLAVLGVVNLLSALKARAAEGAPVEVAPVLWVVGGLAAQILLLIPASSWLSALSGVFGFDPEAAGAKLPFNADLSAGFAIATGVLFGLSARGFGGKPLWLTIPIGIVASLAIYLVFAKGLDLSLPVGPIENLFSSGG